MIPNHQNEFPNRLTSSLIVYSKQTLMAIAIASDVALDTATLIGGNGRLTLIKDQLGASGAFVLHLLLKKMLTNSNNPSSKATHVVFLGLVAPFSHYARIARKQGCNLVTHREKGNLIFLDLFSDSTLWDKKSTVASDAGSSTGNPLFLVYQTIRMALGKLSISEASVCIMVDDVSLLEVACQGSQSEVLDFLHYCRTISIGGKRSSIVLLLHEDIYEGKGTMVLPRELEYAASTVIVVEPLNTGYAADVHGQITVLCRSAELSKPVQRMQFKAMENTVLFFG